MKVFIIGCLVLLPLAASADQAPTFILSSPDVLPNQPLPLVHVFNDTGCSGANRSPALEWRGVPQGTRSFALTMFDLDEHGSPSGWWHWVLYDLPGTVTRLEENAGADKSRTLPA
ncbi:MAG: YbhB/YbcL family Raf kinase inhibitor-like protein, partial [Alphaproteobacteria bacterium]|nr:YbhB/YbcL family Raf kinase inhibitor-like protein [Alphaproteobacteria bacterium]